MGNAISSGRVGLSTASNNMQDLSIKAYRIVIILTRGVSFRGGRGGGRGISQHQPKFPLSRIMDSGLCIYFVLSSPLQLCWVPMLVN